MGRKKLERFADNAVRFNIVENGKEKFGKMAGKWRSEHFQNEHDLVVELGCGRGEYTTGLGEKFPDKNFVGVDIKGSRIWVGSSYAIAHNLDNIAFLRTQIEQIDAHFGEDEVSELWITFPDPRPKDKDEKRRLTAPRFMEMYKKLIAKDGWLKFKTDNTPLFDYTLELIETGQIKVKNLSHTHNLYESEFMDEHFGVKTKYEQLFYDKGEDIKYLKFQFA
ncbi:tRNA (guanosine(46)-N7)-methyltransferase TrmB [Reichenbachiella sp. 5M10]|uniref:tRNA (guanosine(46)-N7)-methyltransferase TrmB n=1 Tax=Reichenbachiella sp. 5M10 TaxID=1889772 RepID=UPI000C146CE5|nr:tRNA (guanosine(46)-N7)-methyltransferase TrmB [Reichenbachiella sp. 5M10]PIB35167.1 tRNA (guanosine(46)-N7)-methyltransferase TrmB [Reichenbachiella sp. 5M10]